MPLHIQVWEARWAVVAKKSAGRVPASLLTPGDTFTSAAYAQSLQAALDQLHLK